MKPPLAKARGTRSIERALGDRARVLLTGAAGEFVMFVLKQGWACLFGGLMLGAIVVSKAVWQTDWPLHRYDALFLFALATQAVFLAAKLETWAEARVIVLFHLTGTAMEWFKVGAGYLLLYVAGVMVSLVSRDALEPASRAPKQTPASAKR